jgi:hypothetical protein
VKDNTGTYEIGTPVSQSLFNRSKLSFLSGGRPFPRGGPETGVEGRLVPASQNDDVIYEHSQNLSTYMMQVLDGTRNIMGLAPGLNVAVTEVSVGDYVVSKIGSNF